MDNNLPFTATTGAKLGILASGEVRPQIDIPGVSRKVVHAAKQGVHPPKKTAPEGAVSVTGGLKDSKVSSQNYLLCNLLWQNCQLLVYLYVRRRYARTG